MVETQGNFVDKYTYKNEILSSEGNVNVANEKKIATRNMFEVTKPLLRLDEIPQKTTHMHSMFIIFSLIEYDFIF